MIKFLQKKSWEHRFRMKFKSYKIIKKVKTILNKKKSDLIKSK